MGGVETYTASLAQALARAGHRTIVVTSNTHGAPAREACGGIEIVRLPCRKALGGRYPIIRKDGEFERLWAWLGKQPIDHVVVNTRFYHLSLMGLSFASERGTVPVLIEHGSAHLTMGNALADPFVEAVEHAMARVAKRYPFAAYAVSKKASAWLGHFGIESQGELANSIDADAYEGNASSRDFRKELGISDDAFLVAFVGRLVKEKGVAELAKALRDAGPDEPMAVLAAGDGPLLGELRSSEGERFHLLGKLDRPDVAALLAQADALCLPSRSEGFATALLEAAACGTPAIVTNVGGVDELVPDDEHGTVIPDRDPETVRRALEAAARNRKHLEQQGRNARALVRSAYSWSRTAAKLVEACGQAQERGGAGGCRTGRTNP